VTIEKDEKTNAKNISCDRHKMYAKNEKTTKRRWKKKERVRVSVSVRCVGVLFILYFFDEDHNKCNISYLHTNYVISRKIDKPNPPHIKICCKFFVTSLRNEV